MPLTHHNNLGIALQNRQYAGALVDFTKAVRLKPDWPAGNEYLALLIATAPDLKDRDTNEAIRLAARSCELTGYKDPVYVGALAAAFASAADFQRPLIPPKKRLNLPTLANRPQIKNIIQYT